MSFVLISPDQIIEVHDLILGEHELQGLAADKSLSSASVALTIGSTMA